MRTLLIAVALVVVVGAVALVALSVRRQGHTPQGTLGPSEAQQNRAAEHAVQKSAPPQQLSETQIRGYQEQLDTAGFPTGAEKGTITPQTEVALRAYQQHNGLPMTGVFDEATQRSLAAGQTPTPGRPTAGESMPGGTAPSGSPR
jgi:peptidoglycan hydrolase-like protein with peptidoglycan-binding domain